jgi:hypothetical protein
MLQLVTLNFLLQLITHQDEDRYHYKDREEKHDLDNLARFKIGHLTPFFQLENSDFGVWRVTSGKDGFYT